MKHLSLIVFRELDHFRGWFFLLLGLTAFTILLHVLVLTLVPGFSMAEFLVIMKGYVVPGIFGILCALMGYADSPEHGSHEFRTRPVRLKSLYLGKLSVIAGTAACLVLVQSVMNAFAGFPLSFWTLWWPLFLGGLTFFFASSLFRPTIGKMFFLLIVVGLLVGLTFIVLMLIQQQGVLGIYPPGVRRTFLVAAGYFSLIFLSKTLTQRKWVQWAFLPLIALVAGVLIWVLNIDRGFAQNIDYDQRLQERLHPELKVRVNRDGRLMLDFSEPSNEETILRRLSFSVQQVILKDEHSATQKVLMHEAIDRGSGTTEWDQALRALGVIPPLSEEALTRSPEFRVTRPNSRPLPIPSEMQRKKLSVHAEGKAQLWHTQSLGTLPIREGAKLTSEDLTVEIVALLQRKGRVRLRVHSKSGRYIQLGVYQKDPEHLHWTHGETGSLTSHDVTRGMSTVDIVEVGIHFDLIERFDEAAELHLFSIRREGWLPFVSEATVLDLTKSPEPARLLRANYPILPSIITTESK